jgi:hypothetical protein
MNIVALEVMGGGLSHIPWVKDVILQAVEDTTGNKDIFLLCSLDDTLAALGATFVGEDNNNKDVDVVVKSMDYSTYPSKQQTQPMRWNNKS